MYVFDATPLIYLATVERLTLVDELPAQSVVPDRVYQEVVTAGVEAGHADARRVDRTVEAQILTRQSVDDTETFERLRTNQSLSDADAAVLAIAASADATAVMDEQYGRDVADSEGIETRGTAYLVLQLLQTGVLTADEAQATIDAMLDAGWYCAPNLYARVRQRIDDIG